MIPRLYLENETNFNHNGIGALTESLSAVVIEEANGIFDLEVTYPIHGKWFSEIQKMRIITALPNTGDEEHRFRINEIVKSTNPNVVIIKASTKTNDISGSIIKEYKNSNVSASIIMSGMKSKLFPPLNYDFLTDITTSISVDWFMRNPLNAILGQEGSLVDALGGGELKRNNTNLYLYRRRGNENVARVAPSKNLRGLTVTESTKGLITRIQPYVIVTDYNDSSGEQTETVILGDVVDSPLVNNYPVQVVVPVDFGEYEITNKTDLDTKAKTYFKSMNPDCDKPNVELDLDLIQISDSSEYEKFRKFEAIKLFDTVSVYVPRYGVDSIVKINRVEFDVLREKVISIKAGQPRTSYSQSLEKTYNNKINDALVVVNNKINTVQQSADGKTQVFRGPNEPDISVSNEGDLWFKVLGNGEVEMYTFDGAYWQPNIPAGMSEEISKKIEEFETSIEQQGKDIDDSIIKANQAVEDAGFSKTLAEEAKSLGVTASSLASEAKTNANKAMTDALEAIRQVELNEGVIADASADATKAFNKSFKSSTIAYATSTNGSTPPTTGWGTTVPTPSPDVYIWTRTTIVLNDNTPVVSYSVGKIGAKGDQGLKGDTGGQGIQGTPGVNAPTIKSVVQQYYLSTSKTTQTGGSWLSTVPVWSSGKYYWVRVVTTYSNDTTSTSTPVLDNALNDSLVTALEVKTANQNLSTTVTQHATLIAGKANSTTVDALTGRVTTAEGKITTQAGQIALKANTSTVNTLTGRVTTAEGNITTQAGQIALKANQSTVDTLTGRVSTTEAKITATDGKVTTLTTKTDGNTTSIGKLQTGYDGLSSTVTALETGKVGNEAFSALEQNLSGFKTTVQNTYADKTTVTQLSTKWTTTTNLVNGHTTQITSMGTQINLRATKTEVDEKILNDKKIKDTRNTNQLPPWYYKNYPNQQAYEFKLCSTIGLPTSAAAGMYASVVTAVPWTDASGGTIEQTATATDGVYQRRGMTTWSAWAKVADSSNIISQINISPESILIASKKIQIKGDTHIDNSVIKTAHIADLAVSGAKIANASISSAKIISLDASKVSATTLSAITTNTGNLNVSGNLTMLTDNNLIKGNYNYSDPYDAYAPRTFVGNFHVGRRFTFFAGDTWEYKNNNPKNYFLGYNETSFGQDYLKMRTYNNSVNRTLLSRFDVYNGRLELSNSFSTTNLFLTKDGGIYGQTVIGERMATNRIDMRGLASFIINEKKESNLPTLKMTATEEAIFSVESPSPQKANLYLGGDASPRIWSGAFYSRTYPVAANVVVTDQGTIGRSVSAKKYKTNIETLNSVIKNAKRVLDIKPKKWWDKRALEETGKIREGYGYIADEFHNLGLTEVVQYDSRGEIEGLAYDRISMYHNVILQDHEHQLSTVTQQLTTVATERLQHTLSLESKLLSLEKTVEQLQQEIEQLK